MRKTIFATLAFFACIAANAAEAQSVPEMLGPGQNIVAEAPNDLGGTTYVIQNADGSHTVVKTTKRGGVRSVERHETPLVDLTSGFTFSLNGGPMIYRPYDPGRRPVNRVDPKANPGAYNDFRSSLRH
jgi:hypothetical protein